MRIGYCCINLSINTNRKKKDRIQVNRGMVKKTFQSKGLEYVSDLIILNLNDTLKVLEWNVKNNIFVLTPVLFGSSVWLGLQDAFWCTARKDGDRRTQFEFWFYHRARMWVYSISFLVFAIEYIIQSVNESI